jgi:1,2-phenylacetyl-CoA epoxidase PaaB subunit
MPARPTTRSTDDNASGAVPDEEWAVFTRETPTDPMIHAGSVRASDEAEARERVESLFPDVAARWICPTTAIDRGETAPLTAGEAP